MRQSLDIKNVTQFFGDSGNNCLCLTNFYQLEMDHKDHQPSPIPTSPIPLQILAGIIKDEPIKTKLACT